MADGGATYTVNIELATRQFSQDLRNLKNKIKNELGKTVKVATGGTGATSRERALSIRKEQNDKREQRRIKYNADQTRAQLIEKQRLIERINKLQSFGYSDSQVKKLRNWAGEIDTLARGNPQAAQQKIKDLRGALDVEDKILQTIINQGLEKEKQAKQQVEQSRKIENRRRKGPHGQRMHGPIDIYGNDIHDPGKRVPAIPKSGASLPVDLQRKTSGTFAAKHTDLLRRRQALETLLSSFDGINTPEINRFKNGIQGLVKQYGAISTSMGQTRNASGFGNAGNIARELELLELSTKKEEYRARNIKTMNQTEAKAFRTKETFLNKEHSIKKTLLRLQKKGVATTNFELKLEKAITAQDQEQLNNLAREVDMTNAQTTRVTKKGGGKGKSGDGTVAAKGGGGRLGRMGQSALISGGFPLLFGQSPAVAGFSALGGAAGEFITPGGGFAGGIAASALATKVAEVIAFRKEISNLNKDMAEMGISSEFSAGQIAKLGKALRVTKQEALEIAKGFKKYGGKTGGLFAEFFGDAQTFEATAGAVDIQSAIAAIKAQQKDMTTEEELGYRIKLLNQGVEETINSLVEKRIALRKKEFDEAQKESTERLENMRAMNSAVGLATRKNQEKELESQIEKEKELITQFERERDLRNELALAAERQAQSINTAIESTEKELRKLNNAQYQVVQLANNISSAFSESFKGIVSGSMTAQEALANLFQRTADQFADMAARMIAEQIKMQILGIGLRWVASSAGAQANFGTGRDGTFGLGTHGSGIPTGAEGFGYSKRAAGGPVSGGSPYIVGEKGPELFVPGSSGNIVPNHAMGGANVVVNVDASGSSVEGDAGAAQELGDMLAAAIQAELVKEKRPGGLLA